MNNEQRSHNNDRVVLLTGIGAQERALRQLNIPYEVKHTCDCDANAVLSYAAMRWDLEKEMEAFEFPSQDKMIEELQAKNLGYDFQKEKHSITKRTPLTKLKQYYIADKLSDNLGDISKVDKLPYADVVTYSFPCTDLSVAGKGEGMVNKCNTCGHSWPIDFSNAEDTLVCPNCGATVSSSTRSGLLGQVQRLLGIAKENDALPKYLLLENVKNLIGKKFKPQFDAWVKWLDSIGYNTYYKVLNAKHFGICQNRERIFAISIRKDVDTNGFTFPEPIPLTTRLKDILEHNVDEKYYLPDERIEKILNSSFMQQKRCIEKDVNPIRIGNIYDEKFGTGYAGNVWDKDGISPTLQTAQGGNRMPLVLDEIKVVCKNEPQVEKVAIVEDQFPGSRDARIYRDYSPTLRQNCSGLQVAKGEDEAEVNPKIRWRIRKLIPKECWRLMNFTDQDCNRAAKYVSASALYKQAGNSIVVACLIAIFSSLFLEDGYKSDIWTKYLLNYWD